MNNKKDTLNKKILFFFNHKAEDDIKLIERGELPSDRLYGLMELRQMGWDVHVCDERLTNLEYKLRTYCSLINLKTILKAIKYDVWIVKDQFSLTLTLLSFLFRKKIVYIDSLFYVPKSSLKKLLLKINALLAPVIVTYSNYQAKLWADVLKVDIKKFIVLPYTIDVNFYKAGLTAAREGERKESATDNYILAAGRDLGRDFKTLIEAAEKANVNVKLVTLPYLLPDDVNSKTHVEVHQRISYPKLFELYRDCVVVAVPLKKGIEYPSGIRAVLEALILGAPTICTSSPVLAEYFNENLNAAILIAPEDSDLLAEKINILISNREAATDMGKAGEGLVEKYYNMDVFAQGLHQLLIEKR